MPRRTLSLLAAVIVLATSAAPQQSTRDSAVRATLDNGLRVVIVHDPLAPVVTVEENYLAGGNDTPAGFPGMAHAQEHMASPAGCAGRFPRTRSPRYTPNWAAVLTPIRSRTSLSISSPCRRRISKSPCAWIRLACRMSRIPRSSGPKSAAPSSRRSLATSRFRPTSSLPASNQDLPFAGARPTAHMMRSAPSPPSKPLPGRCSRSSIRIGMRPTTPSL